ncbi:MAG: tetratricopeptide repeat protein, partial [Candidatus Eisenbacteria bacterium]|nr:tetratricopeptide repeat protein [Candidatus Eisenbacteria bacterium]
MIRRLMVLTTLILHTLTSGSLASAATPTEAIDSLEEARGLFRQGLFMGDIETLDRSRDMRFAALDALDEMDPQSITGVPWPERIAWMEHALFERRADWSLKLLGVIRASSADPFPPVGSANRGIGALVAGMSADAALRGVPNLSSDDKASLRSFAERAYEVSARENFLLRDEAFYRLWRLGDARDNLAMMAEWSDSLAVATPRSLRTPATRLTRVQRFLDLGDFGEALQEARLAMPKGDSAEMRWAMAEANFGLDFEGQGARELEKLIGSFGGQRLAWDAYEKRLRLGDTNTNLYLTKEQRFNLLKPLLKGSTAKRAEAALKTLADQNRSMRAQILSTLTEYYYKTKRYSDAEPYLKELIEGSDSISRRAQLTYARLLRNSGRIAPMEELYERLVSAGGSHGQKAIWELAREYESLARWEDANTAYSRLLSLFPGHGKKDKARYRRGFARYRMGAYVDAESDFRTLFRKKNGSAEEEAAFWLAKSLEAQGKAQEAQAVGSGAISSSFPAGFYGVSLRRDYGKETTAVQSTPLP